MRILSLVWGVPYSGIGECMYTYNRLNECAGLSIFTACIVTQRVHERYPGALIRAQERLNARVISIKRIVDFSWIKSLANLIEEDKPDILFVHGFNGPVAATILQWRNKIKLPLVCSYHGRYQAPVSAKRIVEPMYNWVQEWIYKTAECKIVACAEFCVDHLVGKGIPHSRIAVVHNGIPSDISSYTPIDREKWGFQDGDILIGAASRLDRVKGLDYLLEAFSAVSKLFHNVHLIIVGEGPEKGRLQRICQTHGLNKKVHFVGYQTCVPGWLSLLDIFVLPSLQECHSIALLEAMRACLPIIATNVGGNTESVRHEKEALIVPPADTETLATALTRMINGPDLRERLSKAARKRFDDEFTEDVMLQKIAAWFRSF